ncbi:hypothetical protein ADUPG1_006952, partial [Aduncisulcus paluster]
MFIRLIVDLEHEAQEEANGVNTVGPIGGSVVQKMRQETGCEIRYTDKNKAIVIGSKDKVKAALEAIYTRVKSLRHEALKQQGSRLSGAKSRLELDLPFAADRYLIGPGKFILTTSAKSVSRDSGDDFFDASSKRDERFDSLQQHSKQERAALHVSGQGKLTIEATSPASLNIAKRTFDSLMEHYECVQLHVPCWSVGRIIGRRGEGIKRFQRLGSGKVVVYFPQTTGRVPCVCIAGDRDSVRIVKQAVLVRISSITELSGVIMVVSTPHPAGVEGAVKFLNLKNESVFGELYQFKYSGIVNDPDNQGDEHDKKDAQPLTKSYGPANILCPTPGGSLTVMRASPLSTPQLSPHISPSASPRSRSPERRSTSGSDPSFSPFCFTPSMVFTPMCGSISSSATNSPGTHSPRFPQQSVPTSFPSFTPDVLSAAASSLTSSMFLDKGKDAKSLSSHSSGRGTPGAFDIGGSSSGSRSTSIPASHSATPPIVPSRMLPTTTSSSLPFSGGPIGPCVLGYCDSVGCDAVPDTDRLLFPS